jgi:hypothetical protein
MPLPQKVLAMLDHDALQDIDLPICHAPYSGSVTVGIEPEFHLLSTFSNMDMRGLMTIGAVKQNKPASPS